MRLVLLASLLLPLSFLSTGTAFSQSRVTICLHEASEICRDAMSRSDEQKKRIAQMDERQGSVCRAVAERRFFRDCASVFVTRPRSNLRCYRVLKGLERNMRASVSKLVAQTRIPARTCEARARPL